MVALNLYATQAGYTDAGTRRQNLTVKVNLQVANAGVFLQLANDDAGQSFTDDEEFYPPGAYSLVRKCGGARVRSAVATAPAIASLTLLTDADT